MCTVTVIPMGCGSFRLVTNRDELRDRPAAMPPREHTLEGGLRALWPVDPVGGGTWIGAAEHGLVLTVLNLNLPAGPARGSVSRGGLIPRLLGERDVAGVREAIGAVGFDDYAPFRLLAVDRSKELIVRWDGADLTVEEQDLRALCLVSSGLGDHRVAARLELFEEFRAEHGETVSMQDAFHGHVWAGREEISVLMSRREARTVSTTSVEVSADCILMQYRDDAGMHPSRAIDLTDRRERVSC